MLVVYYDNLTLLTVYMFEKMTINVQVKIIRYLAEAVQNLCLKILKDCARVDRMVSE